MDMQNPQHCLTYNVQRVARTLGREMEAVFRAAGLTAQQFGILNQLAARGSVRISELADFTGTERTTMTRNIEILSRKGLIERRAESDRRTHSVGLSELGRQRLAKALPLWQAQHNRVVARLGEQNATKLLELLREL